MPGYTRRQWMSHRDSDRGSTFGRAPVLGAAPPTAPVAIARCNVLRGRTAPTMEKMFDQLGGLGAASGGQNSRNQGQPHRISESAHGLPAGRTGALDPPAVIGTDAGPDGQGWGEAHPAAGEPWNNADPLEEYMMEANWDAATC